MRWPDPVKHGISVSDNAKDLISGLLVKDRTRRLGYSNDIQEVLAHPFFAGLDTDALLEHKIEAEFKPTVDSSGLNNFDFEITQEMPKESLVGSDMLAQIQSNEENFKDFGF